MKSSRTSRTSRKVDTTQPLANRRASLALDNTGHKVSFGLLAKMYVFSLGLVVALAVTGMTATSAGALGGPVTPPPPPLNVTAVPGDAQAIVSWTLPSSDGGATITSYTVTSSPDGKTCTAPGPSGDTCTVYGLTNGTSYTFTATATNNQGVGFHSLASNPVIPLASPGAPTDVAATPGNAQATVTWTPPADNGGAPITGYTVTSSPDGATCTYTVATPEVDSCTVTGLTNGTAYTFTVSATNRMGPGQISSASTSVTPQSDSGGSTDGGGGSNGGGSGSGGSSAPDPVQAPSLASTGAPIGFTVVGGLLLAALGLTLLAARTRRQSVQRQS